MRLALTVALLWDTAVPAVFGVRVASGPGALRSVALLVGLAG